MKKVAFIISNIEDYGKFIAFCIEKDICIFRTYWDEREKENRCYSINWEEKRCHYGSRSYYQIHGYKIVSPIFRLNENGRYWRCC